MKKRKITVLCAIILVVSLMVGATYAYLSDTDSKTNTFTIGKIDVTLDEPSWDDTTDGKDILPGDTLVKDPIITEVAGDSYMRVKMEIKDTASGDVITDAARVNAVLATVFYDSTYSTDTHTGALLEGTAYATTALAAYPTVNPAFTYDTTRAAVAGTRYYNYTANAGKFSEGDSAVLFTNVVIPSDYGTTEINVLGEYTIVLTAQAIQFDNVENAAAAYTALDA